MATGSTTSPAAARLMGRLPEPLRLGHCKVIAERAAGDDVDGEFPGLIAEVHGEYVRVVYPTGDEAATIVECWLHADQVRMVLGRPPQ